MQVFFVLRKKQSQVTFLHIYHHSNMAVSTWAYLKYLKGRESPTPVIHLVAEINQQYGLQSYSVNTIETHPNGKNW